MRAMFKLNKLAKLRRCVLPQAQRPMFAPFCIISLFCVFRYLSFSSVWYQQFSGAGLHVMVLFVDHVFCTFLYFHKVKTYLLGVNVEEEKKGS